jgi:hypothetical protein
MLTCEQATPFQELDLPRELADLEGLLHADLRAIVAMVAQRAHERLCLTRREFRQLQHDLWNGLVDVVNQVVEPLSAETR